MKRPLRSLSQVNEESGWREAMKKPSQRLICAKCATGGSSPRSSGPHDDATAACPTSTRPAPTSAGVPEPLGTTA